ncbi:MAG: Uncharacterized protein G01um1014107_214 [Parcubacteria group bacterium Gr01-1014_107]|nr:MAG: Uncharacterized protein G01um1014107_214 [Parcubacteria group bacterium Gr01-1014_107]
MDKNSRGLSMVELVVASAILSLFLVALSLSYVAFLRLASVNLNSVKATFLAEEGIEAVRFLKDADWQNIASLNTGLNYHLNFTGLSWQIVSNETLIDGFSRSLIFENVFRDSNGKIVESGGTLDQGSRKLSVSVSWLSGGATTTTRSISTYIADI